jgi:hypothetical protein
MSVEFGAVSVQELLPLIGILACQAWSPALRPGCSASAAAS